MVLWRTFPAGRRNRIFYGFRGQDRKILERTEDVKDKHKAKKKAKQAAETAESEDGLHRSAARLELTEEERADPALQPYIQKAGAKADKLDAARAALPKKRVPVKEKVYDAANGKAKSTLRFEQQDKGSPSLKPNPASRPLSEALLFAHGKIHEVEHENVGVEGGHKGEDWWSIRPPRSSAAASGTTR